jgi:hypothetical protein
MKRIALTCIVFMAALPAPAAGFAQISCSREGLQRTPMKIAHTRSLLDTATCQTFTSGFVDVMTA